MTMSQFCASCNHKAERWFTLVRIFFEAVRGADQPHREDRDPTWGSVAREKLSEDVNGRHLQRWGMVRTAVSSMWTEWLTSLFHTGGLGWRICLRMLSLQFLLLVKIQRPLPTPTSCDLFVGAHCPGSFQNPSHGNVMKWACITPPGSDTAGTGKADEL